MNWLPVYKRIFLSLSVCVVMGFGLEPSCARKPTQQSESGYSQQAAQRPRETPIPLEPTKENKGKRCDAKVYTGFAEDQKDSADSYCFHIQKRLIDGAIKGDLADMREALKYGAHPDGSYYESFPALQSAVMSGHLDAVVLLLDNGADVNFEVSFENTPLISAAFRGHTDIVRVLIERGVDVCSRTSSIAEKTARDKGYTQIVELLEAARVAANCK